MQQKQKWKELIQLAFPVVISKLSFTAMGLVDTAMVGHLSSEAQAAAGFGVVYLFTLYVFGLGIITSVNTLVSQHLGANKASQCGAILANGMVLALLCGILTFGAILVSKPVFYLLGISSVICEMAYAYLFYRSFGILAVFAYWTFNSFFEGVGNTKIPMYVTIAANVLNIALDYAFIFGMGPIPALGLEGAGLATAICNLCMCIALSIAAGSSVLDRHALGLTRLISKVQFSLIGKMFKIGIPMGAQMFAEVGAFLVFTTIAGWAGDNELAASQIAMRIMSITFMAAWGISIAVTTLVGTHQGEGKSDLAEQAVHRGLVLILLVATVFGTLMVAGRYLYMPLFTPFASVAGIAVSLMLLTGLFALFDGVNVVCYGALRGAGDTLWPLVNVIVMHWIVGIPLVYWLTIPMGLGAYGNWMGMSIMMCVQALLMFYRLRTGRWKTVELVQRENAQVS